MKKLFMSILLGSSTLPMLHAQDNYVSKVWVADRGGTETVNASVPLKKNEIYLRAEIISTGEKISKSEGGHDLMEISWIDNKGCLHLN